MTPPTGHKRRSKAQKAQAALALLNAQAHRAGTAASENDISEQSESAPASIATVSSLTEALQVKDDELQVASLQLQMQNMELESVQNRLDVSEAHVQQLKQAQRVDRRKLQRAQMAKVLLKEKIKSLSSVVLPGLQKDVEQMAKALYKAQSDKNRAVLKQQELQSNFAKVEKRLAETLADAVEKAQHMAGLLVDAREACAESRKEVRKLRAKSDMQYELVKALKKAVKDSKTFKTMCKGIYTEEVRSLARFLNDVGCSQDYIGQVIERVLQAAGITVQGHISGRTVGRIILEGGIAAEIQLGLEMAAAPSLTLGGDGTTHKHVNFESRTINLLAEDYNGDGTEKPKHRTRMIGVHSAPDHKSETQVSGWKAVLMDIIEVFMNSPLARSKSLQLSLNQFFQKLKGMHSDHAEDQKKAFRLFEKIKREVAMEALGTDEMIKMLPGKLNNILTEKRVELIDESGGLEAWNTLPKEEQSERQAEMLRDVTIEMGEEVWPTLTDDEQCEMLEFFWVGCSMHKDLNGVKGGNVSMMNWWKESKTPGPILLANKDNAAVIDEIQDDNEEELTAAEKRALEVSDSGGVKTTTLAGLIFKDKDDKKGQQKMHQYWFELKTNIEWKPFPDVANARFQSHSNAAAELILHLKKYVELLEWIRTRKEKQRFSHVESNLYKALNDLATITELVVLALYAQVITHPYMRQVRRPEGEEVNMLDLGPLHEKLKEHLRRIIANPELLLAIDATYVTGALDGKQWENPDVMKAIADLVHTLPHLKPVLVAFFTGALTTWERFTAEFAPGGLIDRATPDQKRRAHMPTTNDPNEGQLGSLRQYARKTSNFALHRYNALKMYKRNGTEAFLAKHATPELMQYIHKLARERDSSKLEAKRRQDLAARADADVEAKRAKQKKKDDKAAQVTKEIEQTPWVEEHSMVDSMKVPALKIQLEKYRSRVTDIPKKSEINKLKRPGLIELLKHVLDQYKASLPVDNHEGPQIEQQSTSNNHHIAQNEQPGLMDDHSVIRDRKTTMEMLRFQLQLYRPLVTGMPTVAQLKGKKKHVLVETLIEAVNQYKASMLRADHLHV